LIAPSSPSFWFRFIIAPSYALFSEPLPGAANQMMFSAEQRRAGQKKGNLGNDWQ